MASLPSVLVVGAFGGLAAHLVPKLEQQGFTFTLVDLRSGDFAAQRNPAFPRPATRQRYAVSALDISCLDAVNTFLKQTRPDWIMNCAAYTAVDDAEKNINTAFSANAAGPANLARAAAAQGARLLHISSDYVFGAFPRKPEEQRPYSEEDPAAPCGVYGHSKWYGDEMIRAILPQGHCIARASWLHSLYGPSFVASILRLGREKPELRVVDDQIGSPTWAGWLAEVLLELVKREARGTFHTCSGAKISWFEFAREILSQAGLSATVRPQTTAELNRPAPRPAYSALAVGKLEAFLGRPVLPWQEGVARHLQNLGLGNTRPS